MNGKDILEIQQKVNKLSIKPYDIYTLFNFISSNINEIRVYRVQEKMKIIRIILNLPDLFSFHDIDNENLNYIKGRIVREYRSEKNRSEEYLSLIESQTSLLSLINSIMKKYNDERYCDDDNKVIIYALADLIHHGSTVTRKLTKEEASTISELLNNFIYSFYNLNPNLLRDL